MRVIYAAAMAAVLSVGLGVVSFGGVDRGVPSVHAQATPTGYPHATGVTNVVSQPSTDTDGDGIADTYGRSEVIKIELEFSEGACGTGWIPLIFQTGTGPESIREASYSGCTPNTVSFSYTVTEEIRDADGFSIPPNSLSLTTYDGYVVEPYMEPIQAHPLQKVDGSFDNSPPSISGGAPRILNPPLAGDTHFRGEEIWVVAEFKEEVIVDTGGGRPSIGLEIGGELRLAQWEGPSFGHELLFRYIVQAEDVDTDGVIWVLDNSIYVPTGSYIRDAQGHDADLFWSVSSGSRHKVDGRLPEEPPTSIPTPTTAPTHTPRPTATPPPTSTPDPGGNCAPGQPCIALHGERTEVVLGDEGGLVTFSLSIRNSLARPDMTVSLTLQAPSGWSLYGEGLADECSSQCSATYKVGSGEQKFVEFTSRPNQVGQFRFQGHLEWLFEGEPEPHGDTKTISVTVKPPPTPTPVPTNTPTPPSPTPEPPQPSPTPTGPGCNPLQSGGESASVGTASGSMLLLLGPLAVVGAIKYRRREKRCE